MVTQLTVQAVLEKAIEKEIESQQLYQSLSQKMSNPAGGVRELLEQLASQELEHKRRVEFLYTEAAFPQTDGG